MITASPVVTEPTAAGTARCDLRQVTVSVIIPTKNRPAELVATVQSIRGQTRRPEELIIIDQSGQSCESAVRRLTASCSNMELVYLWDPTIPGLVTARKQGLAGSSGEVVFFVDDDVTLAPDCVANLAERYSATPEVVGICAVDMRGLSVPWWLVLARRAYMLGPLSDNRSLINKQYRDLSEPKAARLFSGGYMSFRRSIFTEFQFEDREWGHRWSSSIDFSYRVSAKYLTVIDPAVRVLHRNPDEIYNPDQWIRIRVDGAFFFFHRDVEKTWFSMLCFSWLLFAIFVRSLFRGAKTKQLRKSFAVFVSELLVGLRFLRDADLPKTSGSRNKVQPPQVVWPPSGRPVSVALIIPTKNRLAELTEMLRSVVTQTRRPDELIIVDQSERNAEADVRALVSGCADMELKYIWDPQIAGLVNARIRGVEAACSDVVFFVDDDITLQSDCVSNLVSRYQRHPEYAGICAVDVGGSALPWWLILARRMYMLGPFRDERSLMNKRHLKLSQPRRVRLFSGGWMSYRKWVFQEFQFEAHLWGHRWNGSTDFSYRVSEKYPIVIDPAVRIWHRLPYGKHTPEEFVQIRVSGTFFFFARNVRKNLVGWVCFLLVILAIFLRSIWRGLETRALSRTLRTFFAEISKGVVFLRQPFRAAY